MTAIPFSEPVAIWWIRRDLRLEDNAALHHALRSGLPVVPVFIFDRHLLDDLPDRDDARVQFIHQTLAAMDAQLAKSGSQVGVFHGTPEEVWTRLLGSQKVRAVFFNRDYEPYARNRDKEIRQLCAAHHVPCHTFKDHVIFEPEEVVKSDGSPFQVFTPYSKAWKRCLEARPGVLAAFDTRVQGAGFARIRQAGYHFPSLEAIGFRPRDIAYPSLEVSDEVIRHYDRTRNYPYIANGTTRLGLHLRFGTTSIREWVRKGRELNETFLNELIWREFFQMLIWHYPLTVHQPFREKWRSVSWHYDEEAFGRWCAGQTGYPLVDAGMRELLHTGYMHNRVRMVVASFLCKHLLHDWRQGEAWFARHLLDYELASNVGNWQWVAGCGADGAPYFRIFNPESQMKKFDPHGQYVRKWVPEWGTARYVKPIVEHAFARNRALEHFAAALK